MSSNGQSKHSQRSSREVSTSWNMLTLADGAGSRNGRMEKAARPGGRCGAADIILSESEGRPPLQVVRGDAVEAQVALRDLVDLTC